MAAKPGRLQTALLDEKIEIINSKDFDEMYKKIKAKQV